jgi:hypothetical protein
MIKVRLVTLKEILFHAAFGQLHKTISAELYPGIELSLDEGGGGVYINYNNHHILIPMHNIGLIEIIRQVFIPMP